MLIEFYGENFGCFRDEFRLSMLATDIDRKSERGIVEVQVEGDKEPLRLLRAAALYGPNASGKSTMVRAAEALHYLLSSSADLPTDAPLGPYEPFQLGAPKAHVTLGVKAVVDQVVYDYRVEFGANKVHLETLEQRSGDMPGPLFERRGQAVSGRWTDYPLFKLVSESFRPNALLLSLAERLSPIPAGAIAAGLRHRLAMDLEAPEGMFEWEFVPARARSDSAFKNWLLTRVRQADIGVVDLQVVEVEMRMPPLRRGASRGSEPPIERRMSPRLELVHAGETEPQPLPYSRESYGTKRFVEHAPMFYELLHGTENRVAFRDELDRSMHPVLLRELLQHFNCEVPSESVRGQLIFTAHESSLLDDEAKDAVLRRDQIYFTEKRADGSARLYSLAEFKERNNLNVRRRYLQGRYGALPAVGPFED